MATSELFAIGDIITSTEAQGNDLKPGDNAEIIDVCMPEDTDDGLGFYCVKTETMYGGAVMFTSAKRIFTVEEAKTTMVIPTREELLSFLGSAVLTEEDGIDVNSTEKDDGKLLIEGRTTNGVPFLARLSVDYIEKSDY